MLRGLRSLLFTCLGVFSIAVTQVSNVWACTAFGGSTVWDDDAGHVWSVGQSGSTLSGTETFSCGTGTIDSSNSTIFSGSITMKVNHPGGCSTAYTWFYTSSWTSNCDQVSLNYYEYDSFNNLVDSGTFVLITYPYDESSGTSTYSWIGTGYGWAATALSGGASGRHFYSRAFYEADNTGSPNDNCWFSGISTNYRADSLNKGNVNPDGTIGPYPNVNDWGVLTLDGTDSWYDKVGWNPWFVTYYRQNSSNLISNGTCTATIGQRVYMVANWGGGLWASRYYRDNTHIWTIWWDTSHPNNDFDYWDGRNGFTNDWHVGSSRGGQSQTKLWPLLDPPTSLSFGTVTSSSVQVNWSAIAGDGNQYDIWRSTDGSNFTDYTGSGVAGTSYTDSGVSSGQHYWYCVRSQLSQGSGGFGIGTLGLVAGPCSTAIDTVTP